MAWSLICDHPKIATSISDRQLLFCKCFLVTNMAEQSPATRLIILSGLKKVKAHFHCNYSIINIYVALSCVFKNHIPLQSV